LLLSEGANIGAVAAGHLALDRAHRHAEGVKVKSKSNVEPIETRLARLDGASFTARCGRRNRRLGLLNIEVLAGIDAEQLQFFQPPSVRSRGRIGGVAMPHKPAT
jgi:hypothetical protein